MTRDDFPKMVKIEQRFQTNPIEDIAETIAAEFKNVSASDQIKPGQRVALTAGSRGVNNIAEIIKATIEELLNLGADPFIVPAMGSHGGATAEGQQELLNHFGISERTMGVPVKSSMEVVPLGFTEDNIPVYIDKHAYAADHIIAINRVKPHTDFEGVIESGMLKMLAIGLGKQHAADYYHNLFMERGHYDVITQTARFILDRCPITFGIGIVEDQRDDTAIITMTPREDIESEEQRLLIEAKNFLPKIPFAKFDILIVDEMSKTFSGTGMDQNVIARSVIPYHVVPDSPAIARIFVRDLAEESGGNALGIGNADFTTTRLVNKINRDVTYMNTFTSSCPEVIRIPASFDQDCDALDACFTTLPLQKKRDARIVHIKNTLHLETLFISETMVAEAERDKNLEVISPAEPLRYGDDGNIANYG
jgi:hypothetical protein